MVLLGKSTELLRRLFRCLLASVLAGLVGIPATASACELVLVGSVANATVLYDPFAVGGASGVLDIEFENVSASDCAMRLAFTTPGGQPFDSALLGGVDIGLQPRQTSGALRKENEPGSFSFKVAANSRARAEFNVVVLKDAVAEAGEHGAEILFDVLSLAGTALIDQARFDLKLISAPKAQMNIAGAAGAFGSGTSVAEIDFGVMETGKTSRVFLQVRANVKNKVTFSSQNNGFLKHVAKDAEAHAIPYAVLLDGQALDLSAIASRPLDPPRTVEGTSLSLDFVLGDVAGPAGRYEDLLTVDIAPL